MPRYLASLFLVALIAIVMVGSFYAQPVNKSDNNRKEFVIASGENLDKIASDLSRAGLIRSRTVFKMIVLVKNLSKKIQAGYFSLTPAQTTGEIVVSLTKASIRQVWITLPEGLRREEMANLVLDKLVESKMPHHFDPEEFIRATTKLEGRLFPNTYAFAPNVTTQDVIEKLTGEFSKVTSSLNLQADQQNRIVILASIIEREAGADEERAEVAGVLTNRLKAGAALRVDATVQYAVSSARCRIRICDWWPKSLTRTDIAFASPYNTYQNPGLPPAPIGNPGKASLEAALKPKATKYWYYLHDSSGQIHYAVTLEEHNQNICTYLKKDC